MGRTLFISGAGFNIFIQGGAIKYINQEFDIYAGTSSGSFLACAFCFGFSIDQLYEYALATERENSRDLRESLFQLWYGSLITDAGKSAFIRRMIEASPVYKEHFSGRDATQITFAELSAVFPKKLLCNSTCFSTGKMEIFSEWTSPSTSIHWSVMASMSILGLFRPTVGDGKLYIDGGFITDYLPICFHPDTELYYKKFTPDVNIPIDLDQSWGVLYLPPSSVTSSDNWGFISLLKSIRLIIQLFVQNQISMEPLAEIMKRTWTIVSPSLDEYPSAQTMRRLYAEGQNQASLIGRLGL
jgi:predicted acylesterase/phospholipase RssA